MDENGRLIWMNEAFMDVTGKQKDFHKSITSIFPQITKESFSGEEADVILLNTCAVRENAEEKVYTDLQEKLDICRKTAQLKP